MMIISDHFKVNPPLARSLFAKSVRNIEIEISSYCNRVCSYCPNSLIDRRSSKEKMGDQLFSSIIGQLSAINWKGTLAFHRYNEPLSDRSYLISRIQEAHSRLPSAELTIFTNGDYLTEDYLNEIYAAGCRKIIATIHIEPADYSDETATELLNKRLSKFQYNYTLSTTPNGVSAEVSVAKDMSFTYRATDFGRSVDGAPIRMDRAQALTPSAETSRTAPCSMPFTEMQIEMDGSLVPCCNIRSDVLSHRDYVLGKLTPESDLFTAWTNMEYVKWRKFLSVYGSKPAPCSTCSYGLFSKSDGGNVYVKNILRSPLGAIFALKSKVTQIGITATLLKLKQLVLK